jgi:hypothetical protein
MMGWHLLLSDEYLIALSFAFALAHMAAISSTMTSSSGKRASRSRTSMWKIKSLVS